MIEAIIFDKDGTLLDFDAFWVSVSVYAINDIKKRFGREDIDTEEFLSALGVKNGITDIDSILCKGTYEEMGEIVHEVFVSHGCNFTLEEVTDAVITDYKKNADKGEIKPTCAGQKEILERLRAQGKRLLVITTDKREVAEKSLTGLGIREYFERLYTGDGDIPPKPDPASAFDFCKAANIKPENIMIVGDTLVDMEFAKNAGLHSVGVGSCEGNRLILKGHADFIVPDVSHIFEVLEKIDSHA